MSWCNCRSNVRLARARVRNHTRSESVGGGHLWSVGKTAGGWRTYVREREWGWWCWEGRRARGWRGCEGERVRRGWGRERARAGGDAVRERERAGGQVVRLTQIHLMTLKPRSCSMLNFSCNILQQLILSRILRESNCSGRIMNNSTWIHTRAINHASRRQTRFVPSCNETSDTAITGSNRPPISHTSHRSWSMLQQHWIHTPRKTLTRSKWYNDGVHVMWLVTTTVPAVLPQC